ncbi:hypothetical protein C0Q70_09655 [Pomacea canaliculata]|uniref:Uncharacterized protein n=1 Tax=Pomacea canaliculata TaxID=400727 RepID=A0A2T7PAE8_POMCA|nr:hypothetical protein C0Q70_09655 [Pomacea canaliculata]
MPRRAARSAEPCAFPPDPSKVNTSNLDTPLSQSARVLTLPLHSSVAKHKTCMNPNGTAASVPITLPVHTCSSLPTPP